MHQQADKQMEKTDLLEPVSVLLIATTPKATPVLSRSRGRVSAYPFSSAVAAKRRIQ